ncbi:hypothetical protein NDU88_000352 [Pleurodeles waltl]|uniref:Uncharacterized protein n=1 Tax=Pleurodeles waltl TaxID=8319 RepID=A0AAV7S6U1_PLEWA|nr:hypothetical protein NDU88_000352 [Pleurodeles waltl]
MCISRTTRGTTAFSQATAVMRRSLDEVELQCKFLLCRHRAAQVQLKGCVGSDERRGCYAQFQRPPQGFHRRECEVLVPRKSITVLVPGAIADNDLTDIWHARHPSSAEGICIGSTHNT